MSLVLISSLINREGGLIRPITGLLTTGTVCVGLVISQVDFSLETLTLRSFGVIGGRRQLDHFLRRVLGTI